jgi:hypothetical protein
MSLMCSPLLIITYYTTLCTKQYYIIILYYYIYQTHAQRGILRVLLGIQEWFFFQNCRNV